MPSVLALVPPDAQGTKPSRYSFLSEELERMVAAGAQVHTVSPYVNSARMANGVRIHPIPRMASPRQALPRLMAMCGSLNRQLLVGEKLLDRIRLVSFQQAALRVVEQHHIDVVYSPFAWPSGTAGLAAARGANVPLVISLRGVDVLEEPSIGYGNTRNPHYRRRIAIVLREADHIIAVSQALARRGIELGANPQSTSVILKGVDEGRFTPGDQAESRRHVELPERPTILFVGSLIPRKGVTCLLEAFMLVHRSYPDTQLVFCGEGPQSKELAHRAGDGGIADRVFLVGKVSRERIPEYFRACDLLVLPSLADGSGNVMVEASASGRPIVGTRATGIPDYVIDGVNGLLFEKADVIDLADKILQLLREPQIAAAMGMAGRRRVEHEMRYSQMINRVLEIFQQVRQRRALAKASGIPATCGNSADS